MTPAVPLYLQNGSAERMDLDAAKRLRIERKDHPTRLIPLHQVSRIVCSDNLEISTRALMACMQSGVPVAIVDAKGKNLGWCIGTRRRETSMRELLVHALDDIEWDERYQNWWNLQWAALVSQTLLLCGVNSTPAARNAPRVALCNAHLIKHRVSGAEYVDALAVMAQNELAAKLAYEASDPQLLAWQRPGLNLIEDLGVLVGIHAHIDVQHAQSLPNSDNLTRWSVNMYEKHTSHWQQRIGQVMFSFEQFLRANWL